MAELENGRRVCDLCRKEGFRFDFESGRMDGVGLAGYADDESVNDLCDSCTAKFLDDCFAKWVRKQQSDNEVIGGYRRGELTYHSEEMYGGPRYCGRCGDEGYGGAGHLGFVGFPGGDRMALCYDCGDDWRRAADVEEEEYGEDFMSPAAVAAFQWKVESQRTVSDRKHKERREVWKQQGGACADCGIAADKHWDLSAWPWRQPDGFVMVCRDCRKRKQSAAGVEA